MHTCMCKGSITIDGCADTATGQYLSVYQRMKACSGLCCNALSNEAKCTRRAAEIRVNGAMPTVIPAASLATLLPCTTHHCTQKPLQKHHERIDGKNNTVFALANKNIQGSCHCFVAISTDVRAVLNIPSNELLLGMILLAWILCGLVEELSPPGFTQLQQSQAQAPAGLRFCATRETA